VRPPLLVIADDNAHMRWLVRTTFRGCFDEIVEAADGRELFWELVRCSRTRAASEVLVITDIRMPGYSGLDVLSTYDDLGFHPRTVVMTSFPDADAYACTARAGGVLLPKPFATAELRRVVEDARAL
jgi:DNA-binding NtrC family response regulator